MILFGLTSTSVFGTPEPATLVKQYKTGALVAAEGHLARSQQRIILLKNSTEKLKNVSYYQAPRRKVN